MGKTTRSERVIHYTGPNSRRDLQGYPLCGGVYLPLPAKQGTTKPTAVTCKRCIASMRADGLVPRG
jgi:hypothetical protein